MKTAAVITEYNPFHNGHLYQLNQIRENGAECIIIVMSGNFTQRGIPSVYHKFIRAEMALTNGADLVFELPVYYATGSAEFFARGAVTLLDKLGVVDELYFGSECGDILAIEKCADIYLNEPLPYKTQLSEYLKAGNSFPKARQLALSDYLQNDSELFTELCTQPNNILGIEYVKELLRRNSPITPITIKRKGASYHNSELSQDCQIHASANAIRTSLMEANEKNMLHQHVPENVYRYMISDDGQHTLFTRDFSSVLLYRLRSFLSCEPNTAYYDMNHQLQNIFKRNIDTFQSWEQFVLQCKSREYTYTRLNRSLLHLLLQMEQATMDCFREQGDIFYARLLGFTSTGAKCMKCIKANGTIPIISKLADTPNILSPVAMKSLQADLYASALYYDTLSQKYGIPILNEHRMKIVRK